jgi:VanZ family protein
MPASPIHALAGKWVWPPLAAAWTVFMLWGTLSPLDRLPPLPHWELLSFDTAAHAGMFVVTAVLYLLMARWQQRFPSLRRRAFLLTLLVSLALGALIEVIQSVMELGRMGDWTDFVSDAIGAVLGVGLMRLTRRWWDAPWQPV